MNATVLPPEVAPPDVIHSCPSCSHWLPDGTLACPDCQTLTYGQHLSQMAANAQQLEAEQKWLEARELWRSALVWLPEGTRQALSIQQHIASIDQRLKAEDDTKARWTKRLGPLAPIGLFLLKFKSAFFLLFKLKFLLSFFLYFGIYWALFGWKFALGLVLTLFLHEMGHYIAIKRRGLKVDLPVFMPGFGAYVRWYGAGVSREDLAAIALAGPFFGLLAAVGCWGFYAKTHDALWLILANLTAWYNVVNLIPIWILDGAKAMLALSRLQRVLVAITCVVFFVLTSARDPLEISNVSNHYVFLVLGAVMGWHALDKSAPEEASSLSLVYFLGVFLMLGMVVHMTGIAASQLPELNSQFRIH